MTRYISVKLPTAKKKKIETLQPASSECGVVCLDFNLSPRIKSQKIGANAWTNGRYLVLARLLSKTGVISLTL